MPRPYVLLDDQITGDVRLFADPVDVITLYEAAEISQAFEALQAYRARGYYLAGYLAYELGYLLEPKLAPLLPARRDTPLLQFGVFNAPDRAVPKALKSNATAPAINLTPDWTQDDYLSRYTRVMDYIRAGDVYQINLTFPMRGSYEGDPLALYAALRARQPVHYGGVIALEDGPDIVSLSPELFFKTSGQNITMQPMKGTLKRNADSAVDIAARDAMAKDEKSRAENLMIVDLLRNDLSRIAARGSVKVPALFNLESYPTLHQMTSTVTAKLRGDVDFKSLFQSLFPCGSVTGAPKIRAMEIIKELEEHPRGAYCGAMGYIDPPQTGGNSCFNVGIRTLTLLDGVVRYNVGSGVVLDSIGTDEYAECLLKAKVMDNAAPQLIETFAQYPDGTRPLWPRHKARLFASAQALGYPCDIVAIEQGLPAPNGRELRLRIALNPTGDFDIGCEDLIELDEPLRLSISKNPLSVDVQETRHKVSARDFYDGERARVKALTGADEVLFINGSGQLCEGSFTNLFMRDGDHLDTPHRDCGLLPGILRESLLDNGEAVEAILYSKDLIGGVIYVGNSLRGLMRAKLISPIPV